MLLSIVLEIENVKTSALFYEPRHLVVCYEAVHRVQFGYFHAGTIRFEKFYTAFKTTSWRTFLSVIFVS